MCDGYLPSAGVVLFSPIIQLAVFKLMASVLLNRLIPFSYPLPTYSWSLSPAGVFRSTTMHIIMHIVNPLQTLEELSSEL